MKIPFQSTNKTGFRLSQIDMVVIGMTLLLLCFYPQYRPITTSVDQLLYWLIPYIVANFFLFCNVFRVRTKYELCWLFTATINLMLCLFLYENNLWFFISQSVFTSLAIIFEIKSSKYHGILSKVQ